MTASEKWQATAEQFCEYASTKDPVRWLVLAFLALFCASNPIPEDFWRVVEEYR